MVNQWKIENSAIKV